MESLQGPLKPKARGAWLVQSVGHATLDQVVSSSHMLGVLLTLKTFFLKKVKKKKK